MFQTILKTNMLTTDSDNLNRIFSVATLILSRRPLCCHTSVILCNSTIKRQKQPHVTLFFGSSFSFSCAEREKKELSASAFKKKRCLSLYFHFSLLRKENTRSWLTGTTRFIV